MFILKPQVKLDFPTNKQYSASFDGSSSALKSDHVGEQPMVFSLAVCTTDILL